MVALKTLAYLLPSFAFCELQFNPLLDFANIGDRDFNPLDFATHFLSLKAPSQLNNAKARGWYEEGGQNVASVEENEEDEGQHLLEISMTTPLLWKMERKKDG